MKKNEKKNNKKKIPIEKTEQEQNGKKAVPVEQEKTERKKTNWKLVRELLQGHRRYIVYATISVLFATAFSYAVPYVTSFTLDYVIQGITTSTPKFLLPIVESLGGRSYFVNSLFLCGIALFLFTGLNCIFTFTRRQNIAYASEGMAEKLRNRLYRHLEDVPYDYHKHASTGDLVQRCTSDVDTVRRFVHLQLMEIVRTFVMFGLAAVVMFSVNVKMTLISLAFLPFLTASSFVYFKYVQKYFTGSDEAEGALSTMLQENLTGVRVVRAFGQQKSEIDKFTKLNETYRVKTYKLIKLLGFYWGLSDSVGYIQIALSLCMGVIGVYRGTFTLGNVAMFTTYVAMLTWPVRQLGRILADMGKAGVSLGRLDEILSAPVEQEPGKALSPDLTGDIVFDNVCFGYDRYNDVLDGVTFTVKPGQTVAILGATGSGKTSLVHLLQRLYPRTAGSITIAGTDVNDIEHGHLRRNIGIVLQEPFLYSRTIMENIRICAPCSTEDDVYCAARTASVHEVIETFEQGYETLVGERGVTLSGGQQQRVAIARTLMQNAPILIFDDSMSAVDSETDAAIRRSLLALNQSGITFLISHRITTLREADMILVLEEGRITQQGTHAELIRQAGLYRRIAEIQDAISDGGDVE
ncbi:MAG: ABC transporter ATP-binding protein [Firmicutes bacterium HGW-Firmicutes-9]|jgi:ATP-binding cassette subfamily B protein|nr:MAG: ABC transporter ATP-binding protein [Firmicutes bacterium HGW-Firmicutes-9]